MTRVYTGGTFDLLHSGHVDFLEDCKRLAGSGGNLLVGLNGDEFLRRYKGRLPIQDYEERRRIVGALRAVDGVIANSGDEDSKPAILRARADIVAIGEDWATKDYFQQMGFDRAWLKRHHITLVYVAFKDSSKSSTALRETLKASSS